MSMPKPLLLALLVCGLSGCSLAPLQPTSAIQPILRTSQGANRVTEWNQLARHHLERGQVNLAMGAYAQSLALDAGQLEARNAVAVIEAQKGHLVVSRQALLALTRDYPGEAMPHTNLGYVYYLEGDFANARLTLQRAMALGGGPKAFQNLQLTENAVRLANAAPEMDTLAETEPVSVPDLAAAPVALSRLAVATARQPAVSTPREELAFATEMPTDAPMVPAAAARPARVSPPSIPEPAQPRMELVQLAPSIFELKQHEAQIVADASPAAPAPAPRASAAPALAAAAATAPATGGFVQAARAPSARASATNASAAFASATLAQASPAPAARAQAIAASAPAASATLVQASRPPAAAAQAPHASATLVQASTPPAAYGQAVLASAVLTPAAGREAPVARGAERPGKVRLEIANGNGIEGMAKRFRGLLVQMGIAVDRLSNDKPYRQVTTTIQYSPGFEKQAASLQKALQGQAKLASHPLVGSDVRLVLGRDAQQSLTNASDASGEAASAALMASTPAPDRRRN
jgi:tetratricopeptide (TPR) repeat protein